VINWWRWCCCEVGGLRINTLLQGSVTERLQLRSIMTMVGYCDQPCSCVSRGWLRRGLLLSLARDSLPCILLPICLGFWMLEALTRLHFSACLL